MSLFPDITWNVKSQPSLSVTGTLRPNELVPVQMYELVKWTVEIEEN